MNDSLVRWVLAWWLMGATQLAWGQPPPAPKPDLPGQRPDGSVLLPNQWSLRPAGRQVTLGDFPVNIAVHPDGRYAAVLHSGYGPHEIIMVDIDQGRVTARVGLREAYYGLAFSHAGGRLYCSGGGDEVVHVFDFQNGQLIPNRDIPLRNPRDRGIPCGLAVSEDSRNLYVANVWGQRVSELDLFTRTNLMDLLVAPPPILPAPAPAAWSATNAAPVEPDLAAITKRAEAQLDPTSVDAPFPYACCVDEQRQRLYVSLWALSCVAVIDLKTHETITHWWTGDHPTEMVLTRKDHHLFVANANRNTVTALDTLTGETVATLNTALRPGQLPGSTPNSLALSPDETKLFVANACNNNVAVFDVSVARKSHSLGLIPVGWYPTSVRVTPDGKHLLVANGKGLTSMADPEGPQPGKPKDSKSQYIGSLFPGALSIIDLPEDREFLRQLAGYTADAYRCTPQKSVAQVRPSEGNPIPSRPGKPSPIQYVIYIIRENRTYDQVLGDVSQGNGDPALCLFPERVTPNLHRLVNQFVLLDNFYVDAEVSADGHEWSMGAYASDFVEKTWPLDYGHPRTKKFPYPSEGDFPIAAPAGGYIWDQAKAAGVSYRSYGEFVVNAPVLTQPNTTRMAALRDHFDPWFRSFDTDYPDVKRAARFLAEFKRFETEGDMPRLQIVRLPNDHTSGTVVGRLTPTAQVADNDRALGLLVEAVSHSPFWPRTAIFVLEDDAQNGPDHVDAHRSEALAISPYTRHGEVDSTMYSTSSMLRTMELILGLKPMTQFDAAATPMFNAFQAAPELRPFNALPPNVDLDERNGRLAWGGKASGRMDFSKEDAVDEQLLNEVIWRSVRGANNPMPAPVHAAFVYPRAKRAGDDD